MRRLLLAACWLLAALSAAQAVPAAPAARAAEPLAVQEVAPGVYMHEGLLQDWLPGNDGDVGNSGFIVGQRCIAVVDTGGSVEIGQRLLLAIRRVSPLPVCYVINTHAHPDHILGDAAFRTAADVAAPARFVASARLPAALAAREPYYRHAVERDFHQPLAADAIVYPTQTVESSAELDLGGRTIELRAWPTAHTDNDLTVYDRQTRTLFLGDLLFISHLPVLDGNLRGWVAVMAQLRGLDVAQAVPGHGAASAEWPAVLDPQQRYLEMLLRETRAAIKSRMTIQQAVEQVGRDALAPWLLTEQFHRRNVTAAYAELEWED